MCASRKIFRCEGCGGWPDEQELIELEGGALSHPLYTFRDEGWDISPCGPVNQIGELENGE